jgi:hypothetical protein
MRLRPSSCAAALIAAGVLAGCGSSATDDTTGSSPATRTVTHTETEVRTATGAAGPASTTSSSTTSTSSTGTSGAQAQSGSAQGAACVAADLMLRYLGGSGATGHGQLGFALANRSSSPCHTYGYPGVLFLNASGAALPTTPQHTSDDFFGQTSEKVLTVAPGASVSFRLGVNHMGSGGGNAGCTTAAAVQVIAPDDTATMRVTIPGGASECGGDVTVSPMQPGTSAFGH